MITLLGLLALSIAFGIGLIYLFTAFLFGLAGIIGLIASIRQARVNRREPKRPYTDYARWIPTGDQIDVQNRGRELADLLASSRPITFPDPPSRETISRN